MSDATLVRGTPGGLQALIAPVGAGVFTVLAVVASVIRQEVAALWAVVAAVFAAVAAFSLPGMLLRRVYLTVLPTGFAVRARSGQREFTDDDVTAIGWDETVRLSNGVPQGMRRTVTLTVADGPPVLMDYLVKAGRPDPVALLIHRLTERLLAGARDRLARGQRFAGTGWALDREGFWTSGRDGDRLIPTGDLADAMLVDHHLAVWEKGHEQPTVRIPAGEPNVRVIAALLKERLAGSGGPAPAEEDFGGGLGRALFERDHSLHVVAFALLFLFSLTLAGVAVLMVAAPDLIPTKNPLIFGFATGGVGAIVGLLTLAYRCNRFACHQRGVARTTFWGTRRLRYEDVASFTYAAVRQYVNGVYTGTTVSLTFVPRAGVRGGRIKFQMSAQKVDQALDGLRDGVAAVMARDLFARLAAGKPVPWADGFVLAPQGLACPGRGLFGRPRLVPYRDLEPVIQDGVLHLFAPGDRKSFASISTASVNFFPGLAVLNHAVTTGLSASARHAAAQ